jgi:hypothetical protein
MRPGSYILIGMGIVVAALVGFLAGRGCPRIAPGTQIVTKVDTLVIWDTVTVSEPISVTRWRVDSVAFPVRDTVRVQDTLFVYLERERVRWKDEYCEVFASGVQPSVDSVRHYISERVILKTVPVKVRSRWGIGVQAGYGASRQGLSPYIGVGVSYNLGAW